MSAQWPENEGTEERYITKERGREMSRRSKDFGGDGVCVHKSNDRTVQYEHGAVT